jgi:hypothetical protein
MHNKLKRLALATLIFFSGIIGYATLTKGHTWGDDFASYIMQAQSIVEGNPKKFTQENSFTIEKSSEVIGSVAAPWGLPVLLAPLYRLFGLNMLALKSLNVVFHVLFLASIAFFLYERHSYVYLVLFISFFALNPTMLSALDNILSDIPFLFFSTTTMFLIGHVVVERRPLISKLADHLLLGVFFAMSFFIRTNGVLLVLAAIGAHLFRLLQWALANKTVVTGMSSPIRTLISCCVKSDFRAFSIDVSPYLTFVGLTLIWYSVFAPVEASHVSYFTLLSLGTVRENFHHYFELLAQLFPVPHSQMIYGITLPFLLAGMIECIYQDFHILLYCLFTVLLYLFWPFVAGDLRYFFPLLPFYIHFVLVGLQWYSKGLGGLSTKVVQGLSVCLLAVVSLYFLGYSSQQALANILVHRKVSSGPFAETSQEMFSFVREKTPEDSVIVFFKPRVMRMLTKRRSVQLDNVSALSLGSHLCILRGAYRQLPDSAIEELVRGGTLNLIYANSDFRLYQILDLHNSGIPTSLTSHAASLSGVQPLMFIKNLISS